MCMPKGVNSVISYCYRTHVTIESYSKQCRCIRIYYIPKIPATANIFTFDERKNRPERVAGHKYLPRCTEIRLDLSIKHFKMGFQMRSRQSLLLKRGVRRIIMT